MTRRRADITFKTEGHPPLSSLSLPEPWMTDGLCAQTDPDSFFPEKGGSVTDAKATCLTCQVRAECLDYAIDTDQTFGIWGGTTYRERRKLKRAAGRADQ